MMVHPSNKERLRMKTRIRTDELMQPIATFSHATQAGGMIHLGATAGTDSQRRLAGVRPGLCDVEIQIEKMLANVDLVLSKLGAHKNQLIRFKTYVTDVRDFQICESMVKQWLQGIEVDTVFVGSIGFPLPQAQVEVDAVAQLGKDSKLVYLSVLDQSQAQSMNAHSSIERFNRFFDKLQLSLEQRKLTLKDLIHVHVVLDDKEQASYLDQVWASRMPKPGPARGVVITPLSRISSWVQFECVAFPGGGSPLYEKNQSQDSPPSAVIAGEYFYSGGISGEGVDTDPIQDVKTQTLSAWSRVNSLLESIGWTTQTILRTHNLLVDWRDYAQFNSGYASNVSIPYPPRTTISGGLIDINKRIQMEVIAHQQGDQAVVLDA